MIIDSVKSFEKYKTLVPGFDKVYDFLRGNKLQELEDGKHEIDGKNVYCTVYSGELKDLGEAPLEVHAWFQHALGVSSRCEL